MIIGNTSLARPNITGKHAHETGGLSGQPLQAMNTKLVREWHRLCPTIPVIALGGIHSGADAIEKLQAGASLVQLYTGLIYRGPHLISEIAKRIATFFTPDKQ